MKHTHRKVSDRIRNGKPAIFRQLVQAVHEVQSLHQMNAAHSPAAQGAWDRLRVAVLESERILEKPVDKKRK